jgi:ligand-binding sensor domain-containing protein
MTANILINTRKNGELNNSIVSVLFEDSKGDIWLGTTADSTLVGKGVFMIKPHSAAVIPPVALLRRKTELCSQHPFSNDVISVINEDKEGHIWFGGDAGICYYTSAGQPSGSFTNFRKQDGINDDHVNFILKSKSGELWLGTWNQGIYKFNGKKLVCYSE